MRSDSLIQTLIQELIQQNDQVASLIVQQSTKTREELSREIRAGVSRLEETDHYKHVLDSLHFSEMNMRQDEIKDAHKQTFQWIFNQSDEGSWYNFHDWLSKKGGFYWICGKAGSGKSTLMRFIDNDERTSDCCRGWAEEERHFRAAYFFWRE